MLKIAYLTRKTLNRVGFFRIVPVTNAHLEKNSDHRVGMKRTAKKKSFHLSKSKMSKGGKLKM